MAKLLCQSGPSAGHEYPLGKDVVVLGRSSDCDIQILDNMSSRKHCEVRRDGKLLTLIDGGSRNGTFLNDKKVTEKPLSFGDRIRVGEVEYLLVKEAGDVELKDLLTRYEVVEKIGEGGMGIVYKAIQRSMARTVALKVLAPKYASRPRFVEQFINEARAAGKLNHANIIQVHDVATENGLHYFSMEFVDGRTCMQVLREQGSFTVGETLEIVLQVAKALDYAHSQRLIHQDIKPDNIMISVSNAVKLADLGISKSFDEVASDTNPRRVMGTPHYMAPEAAMAKRIDHRVDLYSLGATAYHLLTGRTPFNGSSATDVLKAHVMEELPALQDLNPDVPDGVAAMIERMMVKDPEQRYQTAAEIVDEVRRLQTALGLAGERSNETATLRRLANRGDSAPGTHTTGRRPTPGGEQPTPSRATRPRDADLGTAIDTDPEQRREVALLQRMRKVLVAGVAVLVLLIVWKAWPSTPQLPTPTRQTVPAETTPAVVRTDPAPDAVPAVRSDDARAAEQARQLGLIERDLRERGDRQDLAPLLDRLQVAPLAEVEPQNRARRQALVDEIRKLQDRRRVEVVDKAYDALEADVSARRGERNFDLALSRIAAFPYGGEAAMATRVATLRDGVLKEKDAFYHGISGRAKQLDQAQDLAGLRDLRDKLPASMIGSALEQEIAGLIAKHEAVIAERQAEVVKAAATELAKWNLDKVEALHASQRRAMGDTEQARAFDELLKTAKGLVAFTQAINAAVSANAVRFRGDIGSFTDPDMLGADARSLKLRTSDGGIAFAPWSSLHDDTLAAVATQVLRDKVAEHRATLDAYKAARAR